VKTVIENKVKNSGCGKGDGECGAGVDRVQRGEGRRKGRTYNMVKKTWKGRIGDGRMG